ncbi:MAG: hypothetical protein MUE49_02715 [Rhodospirillales bacterium]|jgi:hypothetical protein|nr:hypothetical protein [Rhodospirillales bacterium]
MSRTVRYAGVLAVAAVMGFAAADADAGFQTLYSGTTTMRVNPNGQPWLNATFGYTVAYDLMAGPNVLWKYTYALTDPDTGGPNALRDISHLIVELTNPFTGTITGVPAGFKQEIRTFSPSDPGKSNPGLPSTIYGVKFDYPGNPTPTSVSFVATHAPMWGDLYHKSGKVAGQDVYAYNRGFGTNASPVEPTLADWSFILAGATAAEVASRFLALWGGSAPGCTGYGNCWALVPDGSVVVTQIPVPAALPILAAALAGFGFAGLRQRRVVA